MRNILRTIMLTMLMVAAQWVAGQGYEIDRVCVGAERHYRIDGEIGSVYTWLLTDPSNTVITLPSVVDTVTIIWSAHTAPATGRYYLTNIQLGVNGCDTLQLGYIDVFDAPAAFAGNNLTLCSPEPVPLNLATATNYSDLIWTTSGNGSFDDALSLNPIYTLGPNDITNGSVILTLTADGLGNTGSCTPAESSISITINSLMTDIDITPASCNGIDDGAVTFVASGGTEPYTYDLDGNINATGVFTGLAAGTYTYIISDAAGCEISGEVTITTPDAILATLIQTNINCFGSANGSIQITDVTGGSGDYEYRINGGAWQAGTTFSGLAPDTYLVEARDVNAPDCIVELGTITITEPAILAANTSHTDVTYFGDDDGSITLSDVTGGSGNYEYSIDGINWQSSPIFPNLPPGTYTVYIRDADATDCFLDITEIIVLEGLAIEVLVDNNVSCFGGNDGQATVSATFGLEPYSYLWSDGQTTATATNLAAGTYTVTVTDADGTEITETITITEPEELLVSVTGTNPTTPGGNDGTATATVIGGTSPYTYQWDDLLAQTTETATGLAAGTYNVTVTDANGCEVTGSVTLTDPAIALALTVVVDNHVTCFGGNDGQATATATGGALPYDYLWSDPLAQTSATATGLAAGTYTVTVTDADGTEITETITITQPDELLVNVTGTNPTTPGGNDGTATATVTGGTSPYTYLWDDLAAQTTETAIDLLAGTYNVTVTDANGCEVTGSITLTDPAIALALTVVVDQHVTCFGGNDGQATATATGGALPYDYLWSDPLAQTTATATNLAAGTYTVTVTDADGTEITETITITQPDELLVNVTGTNPTTPGGNDGTATATVTGGTSPYTYLWDDLLAQTTQTANGLAAGTYNVIVTDANGCEATESIVLSDPDALTADVDVTHISCYGSNDGRITITNPQGGSGSYQYSIDGGLTWQNSGFYTNLAAGSYEVMIRDAINTSNQVTLIIITIIEPDELITQIDPLSSEICINETVQFTSVTTGGTGTMTHSWTGSGAVYLSATDVADPLFTGTAAGVFDLIYTVTDENDCVAVSEEAEITVTDVVVPTFTQIGPLCQNSTAPDLPLISLEGITGIWSPANINTTVAGFFTFTFTPDAGQCGVETTMEIEVTDEIVPTFTQIGPLCQNSAAPDLPLISLEGITGVWTPATINTAVAGFFTFTFTPDAGQCGVETTMEIEVTVEIVPTFVQIGPLCQNSTAPDLPLISLEGITGIWTPATINTAVAGFFTFTFTPDAGQCGVETTMEIEVTDEIVPTFVQIGPLCQNSTAPDLPLISLEGITGSWTPASINTTVAGFFTFTFTPDAGQCGVETTMEVEVTDEIVPTFVQIGPLCQNSTAPDLPLISLEGITGIWTPATINTTVAGTFTFTFNPDAGQCGVETTMEIEVTDEIVPTFTQIGPLCQNSTAPDLPLISLEGITGIWTPATINTAVAGFFTFTFTPDAGQCGVETTMEIEVTDEIVPTFTQIGPLCQNTTAPLLPTTSNEGITGSWIPATINTSVAGFFTFTFTPDAGQCGVETIMEIEVTDEIVPTFVQIGPLCQNSTAPDLPLISLEGITGVWTPATINTAVAGFFTFTFTPDAGQCGVETTMEIEVTDEIAPTFVQIGPLCQNSTAPDLPLTSLEGITGVWTPATINTAVAGFFTFTFTPDAGQCGVETTMEIEVTDEIVPTFVQIGPLCQNSTAPDLPLISLEGITGSWTPATINTAIAGFFTFTFTPDAGQCGVETTMEIEVTDEIVPTFVQIGPLCQNSTAPALPATSIEGITGIWTPATINTAVAGTFTFTFTPDAGQCGVETTMEIEVTDEIVPTFVQIGPLCQNSTAPDLPLISLEGITGIWTPASINTAVAGFFTFTFTPDAGQCGVETTMEIEVTDEIVPTFTQIGPLCQNSTAPDLPLISLEGITGIWTPATINTAVAGFFTFTFTPDAGQCGVETTMEIEVTDEIVPTFVQIGPLCQNSTAPDLPLISLEGITGVWTPANINTAVAGTFTFTFTPDAGQCGVETTMEIEVTDEIVPTFVQIGPLCQNTTAPLLPTTSNEGITGIWSPAVINTSVIGSSTYTFTPGSGHCAVASTMEIEVTNEIVPEFIAIGPLCIDSDAPDLPLTSENGISGTWNPATINTAVAGITTYTFTPDAGQCAVPAVMIVEVSSPTIIAIDLEPTTFWLPNGVATIIADGTAVPLVYSITGNGADWQSENEFNDLAAGPYTAWVMDANGCMDSMSFEILNRVEGDVILTADTVSFCMNIPVIIPVDGNNFTEISSFYIELEFDPSVMSFNSIEQIHPALAGGTFSPGIVGNILQIRYSIFSGSATVPNGASLFSLNFDALQPGLSELRWNLISCEIFESSGQQVPDIYVNGQAEIYPAPTIYAFGSGEYCEGDSLTLQVGTSSAEQLSWVWTGPTGHQHLEPEWQLGALGMNDNGQFTVEATNPYFCSDTKTVDLVINPKPIIYLGYADTICYGQAAILDPGSGFESYLWHDGSTNQTMYAIDPGLYFVSVMDEKGCSAVDSVALIPCTIDLLIPNAFTPNNDALNDIFRPIFRGWEPGKYYMQIYSRWGQLIFESTAFEQGWDGTVDGVLAPPGVYTYVISFEAPSYVTRIVSSPVTGSVTLIR